MYTSTTIHHPLIYGIIAIKLYQRGRTSMNNFSELDILKIAISVEEDGVKLYNEMFANAKKDEKRQQVFLALANEERNHAAIFKNLYKETLEKWNKQNEHAIFENHVAGTIQSLVNYFILPKEDVFLDKQKSFKEIVNDALEQEYRSMQFYSKLAQNAQNDEVQKLLYSIIKEEEQHVIKLKEMIYYNKPSISIEEHIHFIESILNGMEDWVRVVDLEDNIIYANNAMKEELGYYLIGRKCFEVIGRTVPCDDCVSKQAATLYKAEQKEEKINGKIYSVMSSPLKNLNGEVEAVIEVLRDVTQERLMEAKIKAQNKKLNDDLQIARKMQYSLLPKELETDGIGFTYMYRPCEAIGGDFFDVFRIDHSHVGVYIADVSGHGVPASMLTMFLRQTIKKDELSPAQVLTHLFQKFNEIDFGPNMYITMFYAIIDINTGEIRYANAGHNMLPIVFNDKQLFCLEAAGIPISNWVEEIEYKEYSEKLASGDKLLFSTDGITEVRNPSGEMYGNHRLTELILNNKQKDIYEIKNLIINDTYNFKYGEKLDDSEILDDMTLVFLEIK
jgi:sigma-B regulation protein RsbU (phosphoserine phosphatase)